MRLASLFALAAVAPLASAGPVVLFDNLSPGYAPDRWQALDPPAQLALPFVASVASSLSSIELPLTEDGRGGFTYIVRLYAADPSDPSVPGGSALCEWFGVPGGLATLTPSGEVALSAGSRYFVAVDTPDTRFVLERGWHVQLEEYRGPMAYGWPGNWTALDGTAWWPAMRVVGETSVPAVPEPATSFLCAAALAGAAVRRRLR